MLRERSQRSPGRGEPCPPRQPRPSSLTPPPVTVLLRSKPRPGCLPAGPDLRTLSLPLDGAACLVGRASKNANKNLLPQHHNALFDCAVMSRYHASIKVPNGPAGPVLIQDTKSMHGVYVNGNQVQSVEIVPGDTIKFGASVSRLDTVHDGVEVQVQDIIRNPDAPRNSNPRSSADLGGHAPHSGQPQTRTQPQTQSQTQRDSAKCPAVVDMSGRVAREDDKTQQHRDVLPRRSSPTSPLRYDDDHEDDQSLFGSDSDSVEEDYEYGSSADEDAGRSPSSACSGAASDDENVDDDGDDSREEVTDVTLSPEQPTSPAKAPAEADTAAAQQPFSAGGFPWDNAEHNTIAKAHASNQLPSIDHMTSGMDVPSRPSPHFPPRTFSELMRPSFKFYEHAADRYGSGSGSGSGSATQASWADRASTAHPSYASNGLHPSIPNLLGSSNHEWDNHGRAETADLFDDWSMPYMSNTATDGLYAHVHSQPEKGADNSYSCDRLPSEMESTADASLIAAVPPRGTTLPPPAEPGHMSSTPLLTVPAATATEAATAEDNGESDDKEDSVIEEEATQMKFSADAELVEALVLEETCADSSDVPDTVFAQDEATSATGKRKRDVEDDGSVEAVEQETAHGAARSGSGKAAVRVHRRIMASRRSKRVKTALTAVGGAVGGMVVLFGALMTPLSEQLLADWDWPQPH